MKNIIPTIRISIFLIITLLIILLLILMYGCSEEDAQPITGNTVLDTEIQEPEPQKPEEIKPDDRELQSEQYRNRKYSYLIDLTELTAENCDLTIQDLNQNLTTLKASRDMLDDMLKIKHKGLKLIQDQLENETTDELTAEEEALEENIEDLEKDREKRQKHIEELVRTLDKVKIDCFGLKN